MFKNFFKIAFRNLKQNKIYSFISITGLAIGIAGCLMIMLYVQNEISYDTHNKKAQQIYRVGFIGNIGANNFKVANSASAVGPVMKETFPEVIQFARLFNENEIHVKQGDRLIKEENFLYADSTVFDVFTICFISGDSSTALKNPNTLVLTRSTAQRYFGDQNPLGQSLLINGTTSYMVTGVVEDFPSNSHFKFDFLGSAISLEISRKQTWLSNDAHNYIVLQKNFDPEILSKKLPVLVRDKMEPIIQAAMGLSYDEFTRSGGYVGLFLQPLLKIHLHSRVDNELQPTGDIRVVYIFTAIALIILFLAVINFINLTTARATMRANEIGVRKVLGSNRGHIIRQFLAESFIFTTLATALAIVLVELFLPVFNNMADKELTAFFFSSWSSLPLLLGIVIIVGLLSGSYPAFLLSGFQPVKVLKGNFQSPSSRGKMRKVLVVFQFAISAFLIIGTMVIYSQMEYIQNKNLGFDKEHVLVVNNISALGDHKKAFKDELLNKSGVINATYSISLMDRNLSATIFQKEGSASNENHALVYMVTDYDFQETYGLKMMDGRFFDKNLVTDTMSVILNEAAVKSMNYSSPVGKRLAHSNGSGNTRYLDIIGVYKDFHIETLHQNIRPMVAFVDPTFAEANFLSVRLQPENMTEIIKRIENEWHQILPDQPFEYSFFDDDFDENYRAEMRTGKVFSAFTILAIIIASLGLFGLASFTTERRIKEIGIRKVLGATVTNIIFLLSKEFSKWVLAANIIAWPIAWYAMNSWLQNFAYKTDIGLEIFIFSTAAALIIAVVTVSFQALKAAISNPVNALKYE